MRLTVLLLLIAGVAAECPNACSGHGTCGEKDTCSCYQNYQGNDCSERTCYFGIAHVDTPKGDLNADGYISGPLTTVITGSEVYPWGTTEQYPNADANEGHFYMECSNKGICDRKSGECECFDGYEGTACARASCPNDCSGHGTCETIKELAEFGTYDTNAHDVSAAAPASGSSNSRFSSAIEESYAYDLWDQDKTMGCKCDPVYYGADCSLRKCKYGVDPLFYDTSDGVIYQTTVVHLGSKGTNRGEISGSFRIVFHDVFGESYTTKQIPLPSDPSTLSPEAVQLALEALPNGVISATTPIRADITATPPPAVTVARQHNSGAITTSGTIGAGDSFTVATYTAAATAGTCTSTPSNTVPGYHSVSSVSLDTCKAECTKVGSTCFSIDYAVVDGSGVAQCRVYVTSQSSLSDFSFTAGTGTDCDGTPATGGANDYYFTYKKTTEYGAGLGVAGNGYGDAYGPEFTITFSTNPGVLKTIELDVQEVDQPGNKAATGNTDYWVANSRQGQFESRYTTNLGRVNTLKYGSKKLYTNSDQSAKGPDGTTTVGQMLKIGGQELRVTAANAYSLTLSEEFLGSDILPILTDTTVVATTLATDTYTLSSAPSSLDSTGIIGNALATGAKLYINGCPSFSADSDATDTSLAVATGHDCLPFSGRTDAVYRRSDNPINQNAYLTTSDTAVQTAQALLLTRGSPTVYAIGSAADVATGFDISSGVVTTTTGGTLAVSDRFFINAWGPFSCTDATNANAPVATDVNTVIQATTATVDWQVNKETAVSGVAAGNILALNGRRYKVKEVTGSAITLTENVAGGGLLKLCDSCVTAVAAAGTSITVAAKADGTQVQLLAGDRVVVGRFVHEDMMLTVSTDYATGGTITTRAGAGRGVNTGAVSSDLASVTLPLYKLVNGNTQGYSVGSVITEDDDTTTAISSGATGLSMAQIDTTTFQYVSQCSNRGTCDSSTGLCKCFKGYSRDNCDTQNMLQI